MVICMEVFVKIEYIIWRVFNETIVEKYARNITENLIYFHTYKGVVKNFPESDKSDVNKVQIEMQKLFLSSK